jgi:hypothetical protein
MYIYINIQIEVIKWRLISYVCEYTYMHTYMHAYI